MGIASEEINCLQQTYIQYWKSYHTPELDPEGKLTIISLIEESLFVVSGVFVKETDYLFGGTKIPVEKTVKT